MSETEVNKKLETEDVNHEESNTFDGENQAKTYKFPRATFFIVSNEFCERFNYYGMKTILVLYLVQKLKYEEDTATVIYHIFNSLVYFMCVFGAMVADSWLGKYKTILYLSFVYVAGSIIIAIGAIPPLKLPVTVFTILGLVLIAIGSGGIKPCVAAFGGDQFKMPEQIKQLAIYFSLFYFAINAGSFVSTSITPILREDVHCFGDGSCFSLAFGVPGALMCVSIVIFILGKFMYVIREPSGNMIAKCYRCIANAISVRRKEKKTNPREHWLDYAIPVHGERLVEETRAVLKVLLLYIPLPMFWALFDQQGSRWTFQATRMDGSFGDSFSVKPDQMQVVNPILILVFIPLYRVVFYPLLAMIGVRRPLQKLTIGGILAGVAFLISGILELQLEKTYPVIPKTGEAHLRIFNGLPCPVTFTSDLYENNPKRIEPFGLFEQPSIAVTSSKTHALSATADLCGSFINGNINLASGVSTSYFVKSSGSNIEFLEYEDEASKSKNGYPLFRILANIDSPKNISFVDVKSEEKIKFTNFTNYMDLVNINPSRYHVYIDNNKIGEELRLRLGGVYTILIRPESSSFIFKDIILTEPNSIHMFWIIPQYVVMTLGEVMFSVTGLEFSYSQSPPTMKSVLLGGWQLTVGVGNLIVAIIAESLSLNSQATEFFLFAGLMFADMLIFSFLAYRYVPLEKEWEEVDETKKVSVKSMQEKLSEKTGFENAGFKED